MVYAVLEQATRRRVIERVELNVISFNAPALRDCERAVLSVDGVRRASARVGPERWNTVMMRMLGTERGKRQTALGGPR